MSAAPLLFVHIPKTAGTSFIAGLEDFYGKRTLAYDYGMASTRTSFEVQEHIYKNSDPEALYQAIVDESFNVLGGHFPVEKYVKQFGPEHAMIFLRDPVQRLVSEYLHSTRHNDCKLEFPEYYRDEYYINRQSGFAAGIPLEDFGFIGITELYRESIALVNLQLELDLKVEMVGMHRPTVDSLYEISPEFEEEIKDLYAKDLQLYEAGLNLFRNRIESV